MSTRQTTLHSFVTNKSVRFPSVSGHTNFSNIDEDHVGINSSTGAVIYNINHPDSIQVFLKGVRISGMRKDNEGSIWFSTLGQGIYRLNSPNVLSTRFRQ